MTAENSRRRIRMIMMDKSAEVGAHIFNPNPWSGKSRGIIESCWTEYSLLHHCVEQIIQTCNGAETLCQNSIATIQQQWRTSPFDPEKMDIFAQQPNLHMQIEAFFSGAKTLLDLMVQLLSSEGIVNMGIHGFHRNKETYGGTVLNALRNNVSDPQKDIAEKVLNLVCEHKELWIDGAIKARDELIHPEKGMLQLMFRLEFTVEADKLICVKVNPPLIVAEPIGPYAQRVLKHTQSFSSTFLNMLNEEAVPN